MKFLQCKIVITALLLFFSGSLIASPVINYNDLLITSVNDPAITNEARELAIRNARPLSILLPGNIKIDALGIENGKVVYGVIKNFAHPMQGARTMFFDEVKNTFDISKGKIYYGNGITVDNTNGLFSPPVSERGSGPYLLIPDSGQDRILMFSLDNGDLLDPAFFPAGTVNFRTPKIALLTPRATFLVSDQVSDGVWEYDTTGTFLNIFAPVGGVNTTILDNIRGMAFRSNGNLLVAVGGGGNDDTIQEFDSTGASVGTFIPNTNISSPFNIAYRLNDMIISCGSGTSKLHRFTHDGVYISSIAGTYNLLQQMYVHPDNSFVVCSLTGATAGLVLLDSAGTQQQILNGVTTNYGVYRLNNGNYLTTNPSGVHEIDDTTGSLVRTVITMSGQYISLYDPDMLVGTGNHSSVLPDAYKLYSNYPNPFNPVTTIKYAIPGNGFVSLKIYNSLGKEVATLVNEIQSTGEYSYNFNASELSSGIYFYTLSATGGAGEFTQTNKMVLLK